MKIVKMIVISTLASAVSLAAVAKPSSGTREEGAMPMMPGGMPMMQGQRGGMPMMQASRVECQWCKVSRAACP